MKRSETAKKISQEIKVYSEESHLEDVSESIKSIYDDLKSSVLLFDSTIHVKPKKLYIAFFHNSTFVYVILRKYRIDLILNLKKGKLVDPKNLSTDISKRGHWGNGDYLVKITDTSNYGYIMTLVRQSFDSN